MAILYPEEAEQIVEVVPKNDEVCGEDIGEN